jgi:hypothetical protein
MDEAATPHEEVDTMKRTLFTALVLALLVPGMAAAQTTAGGSVTLNVNQMLSIQYTNSNTVSFTPAQADFDAGFIDGAIAELRTKGNVPHEIRVSAAASNFAYTGAVAPAPTKAASDFQWKVGAGSYLGMSTSANSVGTYNRGVHNTTVDYQLLLDYVNDPQGQYDLSYTYEVVSN